MLSSYMIEKKLHTDNNGQESCIVINHHDESVIDSVRL
jgi:hypothetical protein